MRQTGEQEAKMTCKSFAAWRRAAWAGVALLGLPTVAMAQSSEKSFLERFAARWTGGGTVVRDADRNPKRLNVSCSLGQSQGENRIDVNGTCRALIFTRPFGARLTYDPASGRYRGTYIGANSGPATLSGKRSGDALNLTVTWNKPVNGDRTARLTIRNNGRHLAIRLTDKAGPGGPEVTTTDLSFARR
jgi:hypothetical protein